MMSIRLSPERLESFFLVSRSRLAVAPIGFSIVRAKRPEPIQPAVAVAASELTAKVVRRLMNCLK